MTYIKALQDAIRRTHGRESRHVESVPVKETFHGQTVWEGMVEIFDLLGHEKAKQCYAWGHSAGRRDKRSRYVVVLKIPPANSALDAVRASIVRDSKE